MTREIDPDDIAAGNLTYAEAEYLRVRGKLPKDYEMPEEDEGEEDGEEVSAPVSRVTPLEEQTVPVIGNNGGIQEDEDDEGYDDGWNNNQRRAELSSRGLSVNGGKDELIARLRRSDSNTLEEDDYSAV